MYYCGEDEEDVLLPQPDRVCPGLFVSDYETTQCRETLKKHGITHVLNVRGGKELYPQDFTYMILDNILDAANQDILSYFPQCIRFIEEGLKAGGVLVHCAAGVSRSATIVCAFLMYSEHITTEQAIAKLRKARPCCCPNQGFRRQLDLWHEMQYNLEGKTRAHRLYKLHKMAIEYETTHQIPTTIYVAEDPQSETQDGSEELYACGSCRRKLFTSSNIVDHETENLNVCSPRSCWEKRACDSFFIEPMAWMTNLLQPQKTQNNYNRGGLGEIRCPNRHCSQVLGSWTFGTVQCSCTAAIRPSFLIKKHKITKVDTSVDIAKLSTQFRVQLTTTENPSQRRASLCTVEI